MPTIEQLRKQIEQIDASIIEKLAQRQELSKQIGQLKREKGLAVVDPTQEKKLFELYEYLCARYQLSPTLVKRLFKSIMIHSRNLQKF